MSAKLVKDLLPLIKSEVDADVAKILEALQKEKVTFADDCTQAVLSCWYRSSDPFTLFVAGRWRVRGQKAR